MQQTPRQFRSITDWKVTLSVKRFRKVICVIVQDEACLIVLRRSLFIATQLVYSGIDVLDADISWASVNSNKSERNNHLRW